MKLISAVIKPFKLDEVKVAAREAGVSGMTVSQVRGFGRTGGHIEIYRGKEYEFDFVDKLQVEIVTTDEMADAVADRERVPDGPSRFRFIRTRLIPKPARAPGTCCPAARWCVRRPGRPTCRSIAARWGSGSW